MGSVAAVGRFVLLKAGKKREAERFAWAFAQQFRRSPVVGKSDGRRFVVYGSDVWSRRMKCHGRLFASIWKTAPDVVGSSDIHRKI